MVQKGYCESNKTGLGWKQKAYNGLVRTVAWDHVDGEIEVVGTRGTIAVRLGLLV
jgi:hypothetical protein